MNELVSSAIGAARPAHGPAGPNYMSGFGNTFETEALAGRAAGRPQLAAEGELRPLRRAALRLAVHRAAGHRTSAPGSIASGPTVRHTGRFERIDSGLIRTAPQRESELPIGQLRWGPTPLPSEKLTFVTGLRTMTTAGDCETMAGMAAHVLLVTASMVREHFFNADGELLIVAQQGGLRFRTEFGVIEIEPGEVCVIPRGVIFRVELVDGPARAYVCENYGGGFTLPDRGPIGANCLANPRDFLTPVAAYEDVEAPHTLIVKWGGELYPHASCRIRRSTSSRGTATTIPTNTICAASRRSARSRSIIPIRRSSR